MAPHEVTKDVLHQERTYRRAIGETSLGTVAAETGIGSNRTAPRQIM